MRFLKFFLGLAVATLLGSTVSVAEDRPSQSAISYSPSLGDMMVAVQLRHSKLWYAGRTKNWRLAEYELGQLRSTLDEGAKLHSNMPAANMTATDKSAALVGEAIKLKDGAKFDIAFGQMTAACNGCHQAADRDFISIRVPTRGSPFSNQLFAPY